MMPKTIYKIVFHKDAFKELRALPKHIRNKARTVIDALKEEPVPLQAQKLKGSASSFRIRLGDYRLIYEVHALEIVIYVVGIAHRKEVYLRLLRRR